MYHSYVTNVHNSKKLSIMLTIQNKVFQLENLFSITNFKVVRQISESVFFVLSFLLYCKQGFIMSNCWSLDLLWNVIIIPPDTNLSYQALLNTVTFLLIIISCPLNSPKCMKTFEANNETSPTPIISSSHFILLTGRCRWGTQSTLGHDG